MKNHETTLKNHGNQPKTMINHETTLKNHGNQQKTMNIFMVTGWFFMVWVGFRGFSLVEVGFSWFFMIKKREVTDMGPQLTSMIKKCDVTDTGPQLTSMIKNVTSLTRRPN